MISDVGIIRKLIEQVRGRVNSYRFNKARKELKTPATIRIFIPNAPNFGHQSAAIALLDQLSDELEIQNKATKEGDKDVNGAENPVIEAVYDETVEQRLQTLKPGFENLNGRIYRQGKVQRELR